MTDTDDIGALAAEFVLGTLDASERASVAARRLRDKALDDAIVGWERRLSPLAELGPDVSPPADLFERIEMRLSAGVPLASDTNVVDLRRRLTRWRSIAVGASALAASLAGFIAIGGLQRPAQDGTFVASFQKDDHAPEFIITVDVKNRTMTVRPVAATKPAGKTFQLWIAHESFQGPRPLGLVIDGDITPRPLLKDFDPSLIEKATFGVSLEPEGGSPTGKPTSPALHSKLFPVAK